MSKTDCEFCALINGGTRKYLLFESEYWVIYLADDQNYPARCIIPMKRHCARLSEITEAENRDLFLVIRTMEDVMINNMGVTNLNWTCLMNGAYGGSGEPDPHVHMHMIPRYEKPVCCDGQEFTDTEFGNHYLLGGEWQMNLLSREKAVEKLRPLIGATYMKYSGKI